MARNHTITFNIVGNENLSAAVKAAQNALKGLKGFDGKKLGQESLANALKQYKALQTALQATNGQFRTAAGKLGGYQTALARVSAAEQRLATAQAQAQQKQATLAQARARLATMRENGASRADLANQRAEVARLAAEYKNLQSQVKTSREELKSAQGDLKTEQGNRAAAQRLNQQFQRQLSALNRLKAQLSAAGVDVSNLAAAEARLQSQIAAANREFERQAQLTRFHQAGADLSNAYSNFQNSLQTAQTLINPFEDAAKNAMNYEKSLSRLKSLTQIRNLRGGNMEQVAAEMRMLDETIQHLARTTEYFGGDIVEAANFYAMSGWSAEQIKAALPATVDLASITQLPIARVADMFSDDMTAFGIKAGQAYKLASGQMVNGADYFNDAIAYATTQSNMDFSTFHESWKYNAPTAKAMQLSLGEAVAQNMMLANAGIKGSMSGTSLRQFWVRLSAPPKTAVKSLEEMGYAANDATQQVMDTQAAMEEAGASMSSGLFEKIGALRQYYREGLAAGRDMTGWLKGLTGQTALSGVQALFDDDVFDKAIAAAQEIDSGSIAGWSQQTAAIMRDNTQTAVDYLKSALDATQLAMGQALLPAIRSASEAITPLVGRLAEWAAANPAVVQTCAALAAAIAAATVAVTGFSLAMAGVRFAQAGWATASMLIGNLSSTIANVLPTLTALRTGLLGAGRALMALAFSPVGAALMAVGLAGYYAYTHWDKVAPVLSSIADTLSGAISPAVDAAMNALSTLATAFEPLKSSLGDLASFVGGGLLGAFVGFGGTVASVIASVIVGIAGLVKTVAQLGSGLAEAFGKIASGDWSGGAKDLLSTATQAADNFKAAWVDSFKTVEAGIKGTAAALDNLNAAQPPPVQSPIQSPIQSTVQSTVQSTSPAQIDTSALQMSVDSAASSMNQVTPPAQTLSMSLMMASPATQALAFSAQGAAASSDALGFSASAATGGVDALSFSAAASTGSVGAMAGAADSASGSLGGLAGAAASAVAGLFSAASSAAGVISSAASSAWSAITGKGGGGGNFYRGGLVSEPTFFAGEHGREMIIPLTEYHQRATSLWRAAGQMLGILPTGEKTNVTLPTREQSKVGEIISKAGDRARRHRGALTAATRRTSIFDKSPWFPTPTFDPMGTPTFPPLTPDLPTLNAPDLPTSDAPPVMNFTINAYISGNADEQSVRRGVEGAIPTMKSTFEEQWALFQRERQRRSYR